MSDEWVDPYESGQLFGSQEVLSEPTPWFAADSFNNRAHREARAGNRYYCPSCGEVHHAYCSPVKGWVVGDHVRCLPAEGKDYYYARCPGGSIDKDKDKAP